MADLVTLAISKLGEKQCFPTSVPAFDQVQKIIDGAVIGFDENLDRSKHAFNRSC